MLLLALACVDPTPEAPPDTDLAPDTEDTTPVDTETDVDSDPPAPPDPTTLPPVLTVDPPPGVVTRDLTLTLTSSDPTAAIWYTLDGTPPVAGVSPRYQAPIAARGSVAVRAIVENDHGDDSIAGAWVRATGLAASFSTDVPVIVLYSLQPAPEEKSELWTPFFVNVFEPVGGRVRFPAAATLSAPAGLKVRGSSSAWYPKRPYRLEVWEAEEDDDEDVPMLGMPADSDWILGAPLDFDRALIRDPLIFDMSNLLGRQASRTQHVELFVTDQGGALRPEDYVGVYVLTETIKQSPDRVDITRLDITDLAEPEITGGYLFKEDRTGPGESGFYAGFGNGLTFQQPFVLVDPEELDADPLQQAWLASYLDELGLALTSPGFTHPSTGRHYRDLIDVDAWIDHHILNTLTKNPDAFRLSGYLHKDREGVLVAGPIWDFDRTMGCASDFRATDPTGWDATDLTTDTTYYFQHGFWGGLFRDAAFREAWLQRWRDVLDHDLSVPVINALIDGYAAELAEAGPRNALVWSSYPPREGTFESEIELLRDWLTTRHAWIRSCVDQPDPTTCPH